MSSRAGALFFFFFIFLSATIFASYKTPVWITTVGACSTPMENSVFKRPLSQTLSSWNERNKNYCIWLCCCSGLVLNFLRSTAVGFSAGGFWIFWYRLLVYPDRFWIFKANINIDIWEFKNRIIIYVSRVRVKYITLTKIHTRAVNKYSKFKYIIKL